jgi:hypothetical protein
MTDRSLQLEEFEEFSNERLSISLYGNGEELLVECYNQEINELDDWTLDKQQTIELIASIIAINKLNIQQINEEVERFKHKRKSIN